MYLSLSDLPSNSLVYLLFTEEKSAENYKTVIDFVKTNMALPGVGVFPGENPEFIVQHLRKAGFPVKAVWAQVSPLQKDLLNLRKILTKFLDSNSTGPY